MIFKIGCIICCASVLFGAQSYEEWLGKNKAQYQNYKKSLDEEFANGLKKEWEVFKSGFYENPYAKPKPKTAPKFEGEPKSEPFEKEIALPKVKLAPIEEAKPIEIQKPKPQIIIAKTKDENMVDFEFFGSQIKAVYPKNFPQNMKLNSSETIAKYYENISKIDTKSLQDTISQTSQKLSLNDWGKYLLTQTIASKIYTNDKNSANALAWFLLLKQNFDVKIAIDDAKNLILLGNFEQKLYQVSYVTVGKKAYFVLSPDGKSAKISSLQTYEVSYSQFLSPISPNIKSAFAFEEKMTDKILHFTFDSKEYAIKARYNNNAIEFLKTFPQTEYAVYFDAKEPNYLDGLVGQLRAQMQNMNEISAVNFLLRFVQKSFNYKTDTEQFSYEKVMLPEETIFYPFSDCEDRSIIFSYLVKSTLGLKVVGMKFSDHLATAVKLNTQIEGDSFVLDGERYFVADPTFINSNIGMTMPQYKNAKFGVVR